MTVSSSRSKEAPLRVVIFGYGLAGSVFHAPLVAATTGMVVAAIVTSQAERQEQARKRYPGVKLYAHADEVWREAQLYDLAIIATTNKTHVPLALKALEAGLPVVIDKPFAPAVADGERLLLKSKEVGRALTVFQNRRWDSDFLTVRKLLSANLLGTITRFESRFERYRAQPRPGAWRESAEAGAAGGQLFDLGNHLIDQALQLFGRPETVYAEMSLRRPGVQVDDDSFVALHFAQGVHAHLWVSQVARIPGQRMRVSGLRGTYEKWGLDLQEDALRSGATPLDAGWGSEPRENWGNISTEIEGVHIEGKVESIPGAYQQFYALLRDALLTGSPLPVDPADALFSLRVIEAAQQSAQEGRVVSFGD